MRECRSSVMEKLISITVTMCKCTLAVRDHWVPAYHVVWIWGELLKKKGGGSRGRKRERDGVKDNAIGK